MKFKTFVLGQFQTNCYMIWDENKNCVLIDPAAEANNLINYINKNELKLAAILLTHSHFDHIGAVKKLRAAFGVPVYIHREEIENKDMAGFASLTKEDGLTYLEGDEELRFGDIVIKVMWTPGHTPGGVCFIAEDCIFAGDTLFMGSCGRVDFPGGSFTKILESLKKLAEMEGNYRVYPGHGPETTLAEERRSNPYMRRAMMM